VLRLWVSFTALNEAAVAYGTLTLQRTFSYHRTSGSYHASSLRFSRTASHVRLWQLAAPERSLTGDTPACCPELVFLVILGRDESTANSVLPASSVKRGFLGLDAWFDEPPSVRDSSLIALLSRSRPAYDICPSEDTSQPTNFTGQCACCARRTTFGSWNNSHSFRTLDKQDHQCCIVRLHVHRQ
jgi:hypothetical protein